MEKFRIVMEGKARFEPSEVEKICNELMKLVPGTSSIKMDCEPRVETPPKDT